jgi:hypothetical protein
LDRGRLLPVSTPTLRQQPQQLQHHALCLALGQLLLLLLLLLLPCCCFCACLPCCCGCCCCHRLGVRPCVWDASGKARRLCAVHHTCHSGRWCHARSTGQVLLCCRARQQLHSERLQRCWRPRERQALQQLQDQHCQGVPC